MELDGGTGGRGGRKGGERRSNRIRIVALQVVGLTASGDREASGPHVPRR